jgi:UDP-glucose 4-epimerase
MSVLITGGSGFVGTWVLRELLAAGEEIVVYDIARGDSRWNSILGANSSSRFKFVQGDLLNQVQLEQTFDDFDVSHVIHLGALLTPECQSNPALGCQVNVMGTVALFEAIRKQTDRIRGFSYASSRAALGDPNAEIPPLPAVAAQDELRTPTFYGVFKRATEAIAGQYWQHFQVALRPFIVYGPERVDGLTAGPSIACRVAVDGGEYTIGYEGAAGYDYVEDVAKAFVRAAFETPPGAFACDFNSQPATPADFIRTIDQMVPGSATRLNAQGPQLPHHETHYECQLATLFPNWQTTSLEDGIRATIDFYQR